MNVLRSETYEVRSGADIVAIRQVVRRFAQDIRLSLVDQTKIVTAASELARNMVDHGGGGTLLVEMIDGISRQGIRLTFEDQGPGIPDIELALRDGYTTGNGMGLGLPGARRLANEFQIQSSPGQGTRVSITRWR